MSEKSIKDSILNQEKHFNFIPKSNDSFVCTVNKNIVEIKNQINTKFEQLFSFISDQQQQTYDRIIKHIDDKLKLIEDKYDILSNKINESKQSIDEIKTET